MRSIALVFALLLPSGAFAQTSTGGWPSPLPVTSASGQPSALPITAGQPPAPPVADGVPVRVVEVLELPPRALSGQQHWVALSLALGQPSVGRMAVKVLSRENDSLWLEAYGGSALFDTMYGFGIRLQHTALTLGNGDSFFISPGLGVHILPEWYTTSGWRTSRLRYYQDERNRNVLCYLAGDIDFSWLHDFSPRFGYELGLKLGIAGRISGNVGDHYPRGVMWGRDLYPIVALYTGFRF